MKNQLAKQGQGMLLGAGLTIVGIIIGAAVFGDQTSAAYADVGGPNSSLALPAITMGPNEVALVTDHAGRYLMINTRGNVAPLLIKDTDLRTGPGESLVRR